jgi:hypothetical protein
MHEAIMNRMIAYPEENLGQCAQAFGITAAWLSTLIHSNCFQARLKEKQAAIFGMIGGNLVSKLQAVADVGVERLAEMVETSTDPRFVKDTTDMVLTKLGFGAKAQGNGSPIGTQNVQQNFYMASKEDLAEARARMNASALDVAALPAPPEVKE